MLRYLRLFGNAVSASLLPRWGSGQAAATLGSWGSFARYSTERKEEK